MSNEEPLLTFFEEQGPIVVCQIRSASVLDAVNVSQFGKDLLSYVEKHPKISLLLDFESVEYLSSAVLTELLRVHKRLQESGGSLRLCGLNQDIRKVFEITNLDKVFVIYDSLKEGLKRFKRSLEIEAREEAWDNIRKDP